MDKQFNFPYIWIERKYRVKCMEYTAHATGIRLTYDDGIDEELIEQTDALLNFLRKNYFFPVRVNIAITNHRRYHSIDDGHIYYGIFYSNVDLYPKRKIYPRIAVAGQLWKHTSISEIHTTLLHELTHYFQWFFGEDKNRSTRSLELEANRWANYILNSFEEESKNE